MYRTITWTNCKGAFVRAFRNSATVFIIIAAAGPFSWLLTSLGAIKELEEWLLGYTHSPILFALVLCIFIYLLGMVMDSDANIIVVGPVIVEVMVRAGYPDVQAALVCVVGFLIGAVTPPLGVAYFTGAAIGQGAARERRDRDAALHRGAVLPVVPAGTGTRHHDVAAGPAGLHGVGGGIAWSR